MKVIELTKALSLTIFGGKAGLEREVTGGYTSDLLSDVIGNSDEGQIWMTLQTHKNVVAVASLKDLAAVILVKGAQPDTATLAQCETEGIPLLGTPLPAFEIGGKLYQLLTPQP